MLFFKDAVLDYFDFSESFWSPQEARIFLCYFLVTVPLLCPRLHTPLASLQRYVERPQPLMRMFPVADLSNRFLERTSNEAGQPCNESDGSGYCERISHGANLLDGEAVERQVLVSDW